MEPRFQTSFIPKKPITATQMSGISTGENSNIFSVVATVVFVFTILASGGIFFYKNLLIDQNAAAVKSIQDAEEAFQLGKIQDLIDANSRIMATNTLLEKHVVVSKLLLLLERETLKKVRFDDLQYKNINGQITLGMKAESQTYNALASQSDIFSKDEFIKSPDFFNFAPIENGNVTADFRSTIDPSLVSYKKAVDSVSLNL